MTKEQVQTAITAHRRRVIAPEQFPGFHKAAVLLLLFPKDGKLSILLTMRTNTVDTHKGQISCPGGMRDPGDADLTATALRETEEELGIPRNTIEILGMIDDLATPTHFIITPVVGYMNAPPVWKANADEVAAVLEVPLSLFVDREKIKHVERTIGTITGTLWYFPFQHYTIWGATAAMIVNLVDIVKNNLEFGVRNSEYSH